MLRWFAPKTAYMYNKTGMNNYPIGSAIYKVTSYIKSSNMKKKLLNCKKNSVKKWDYSTHTLLTNLSESSSIGKSMWTQWDAFLQLLINISRLTWSLFWLSQTASSSLKDLHQENVKGTVIQQFKPMNEWPSLVTYF